tara:strand:+ start:89 stop:505 length:417 start_codon:yes stop_codon:yes gene_type:complete
MPEDKKKKKPIEKKEDTSLYEQAQVRREAREEKSEADRTATRTEEYYDAGGNKMYQTFEGGRMTGRLTPEEAEEQGLVLNGEIVDERRKKAESGQSVDYGFDNAMSTTDKLLNDSGFTQERYLVVINGIAQYRTFLVR